MRIITTLLLLLLLCLGCEKPIDYGIDENSSESSLAKPEFVNIGETPFSCLSSSFKVNSLLSQSSGIQPNIQLEVVSNLLTKPALPRSIRWSISTNNDNIISYSPIVILPFSSDKQYLVSLVLDFGSNVTEQVDFCITENNSRLEICSNTTITGGGLSCEKDKNESGTIDHRAGGVDVFIY